MGFMFPLREKNDVWKCLASHNAFYLQYEGSIEENTEGVEVMRIKAKDLDLETTENWEAMFDIVRGNEAGYFSIKTDPATNEGILMLDKVHKFNKTPLGPGSSL